MPRLVRLVDHPDAFEVICETETTMVLRNPAAKRRQEVAALEKQLAAIRRALEGDYEPAERTSRV